MAGGAGGDGGLGGDTPAILQARWPWQRGEVPSGSPWLPPHPLRVPVAFGSGKLGLLELGVVGRGHPTASDPLSTRSRLHSNHLFCDCHLAWLSQWLRQRPTIGLFTQCAAPAQLRGLNVAEIQKNEFSCSGEGAREAVGTGAGTRMGSQICPVDSAHLRCLGSAVHHGLHPWCGDTTGTPAPCHCDKGV